MQLIATTCLSRHPVAVFVLCLLQAATGLTLPTSTPNSTTTSPEWSHLLEVARLVVSRWLNETTAIIAIGAIVGLAAASFAVFGLDWKDYNHGPPDRLVIDERELGCQESMKHTGV
ncbi:hypothetical protein INS49_004757 [Diaporthe citri]|uniref:uncharacterized protein n=1 Tax=Diaporthe citri TaxID=83186 RepID=UPI001C819FE4|nr:uncharacterized protein INS49_004757 [Diaporthe citri]KAG6354153.1 hypothetical protein INS49_004757 [Diaporthe citri]